MVPQGKVDEESVRVLDADPPFEIVSPVEVAIPIVEVPWLKIRNDRDAPSANRQFELRAEAVGSVIVALAFKANFSSPRSHNVDAESTAEVAVVMVAPPFVSPPFWETPNWRCVPPYSPWVNDSRW